MSPQQHRDSGDKKARGSASSGRLAGEIAEPAAQYDAEPSLPLAVARRVLHRLDALEARYSEQGRSLADFGSAEELAQRMIATVPLPSPWGDLGPFYSTSGVSKLLGGVSRQAIADRRKRETLLALRTADDTWVYPTFQFDDHQTVLEGLAEIWKILRSSGVDGWTLASWLTSPMRSLEGRSPIDCLRRGEDRETLLVLARDAARRFSR